VLVAAVTVVVATLVAVDGPGATRSAKAAAPGYAPRYHAISCPPRATPIDIQRDSSEQCGVLTVPENRARPNGHTIDLDVFRFPSVSPHPAADPIVQVGADFTSSEEPSNSDLRTYADSIYLAGRGFYGSNPYLRCTAVASDINAALGRPSRDPRNDHDVMRAVDACRARWVAAGIDLAAYTTAETADDVRDLALALHLPQINLLAARDLTIEARDIAGRYPGLIRSITLLDVVPPGQNRWNGAIDNANGALDRLAAECNSQPACSTKYPHLRQDMLDVFGSLQGTPDTFVEKNPFGAVPAQFRVVLDGDRVMQLIVSAMEGGNAGIIPAALTPGSGTAEGAANDALFTLTSPDVAWGALLSVYCSSEARTVSAAGLDSEAGAAPDLAYLANDPILRMCTHWITGPTNALDTTIEPGPVVAPTLIMIGGLDPSTSTAWAQQTARGFTHSRIVVLPRTGSLSFTAPEPCANHIRATFIAYPRQTGPTDTCQTDIPPLHFTGT
jgi:pimeloyl-ACP methyl ester carboxylesterase